MASRQLEDDQQSSADGACLLARVSPEVDLHASNKTPPCAIISCTLFIFAAETLNYKLNFVIVYAKK